MNKPKIFIDGKEGTTGLEIYERLMLRSDIELLLIDESLRKDESERKKFLNEADCVFLCLPDYAAIEAVNLIENPNTIVIDASTAHRTHPDWDYGFPELSVSQKNKLKQSKRIANPGCHATGFISIIYPLIHKNYLTANIDITCFSITGYSGGGKAMIKSYEDQKTEEMNHATLYKLDLNHKHIPEMMHVSGLIKKPLFIPILDDFYRGMSTSIAFNLAQFIQIESIDSLFNFYRDYYKDSSFVSVSKMPEDQMLATNYGLNTNQLNITISGNSQQVLFTARFDNLGKGASGAAIQNMNIALGMDETCGL